MPPVSSPPPPYSDSEESGPTDSDSESDAVSYYSFEIDEYSSSSESGDAENTAYVERRGDAPGFPIYVESDSEDDDFEDDV
ncbi:hypothetical protein FKP32DRAFT_1590112 [Trametes sanguinea]|nr:hypothetical protein FKP32DRAFT_1590112 [Trametes sanguinea]